MSSSKRFEKTRKVKRLPLPDPEVLVGKRVTSLAGRDRGRTYTVSGVFSDRKGKWFAMLVNGENRTEASPKRKALCHLQTADQTEYGNGGKERV